MTRDRHVKASVKHFVIYQELMINVRSRNNSLWYCTYSYDYRDCGERQFSFFFFLILTYHFKGSVWQFSEPHFVYLFSHLRLHGPNQKCLSSLNHISRMAATSPATNQIASGRPHVEKPQCLLMSPCFSPAGRSQRDRKTRWNVIRSGACHSEFFLDLRFFFFHIDFLANGFSLPVICIALNRKSDTRRGVGGR